MATTSLLLMQPLKFENIDKSYAYLSPDIRYFNDHHLAYAIVAIVLTIVIIIGFPLLLLSEPFLNSKINFVKIKPLLDQFQGCYRDDYRCFAGYYMICRLVIISFVIINNLGAFNTHGQYLLISSCALMQLIHVLVRPYASTFNNIFDGVIMQLIVVISVLPVVDNYNETFIQAIIYLLVILPLTSFTIIKLWNNKDELHNFAKRLIELCSQKCFALADDTQGSVEMREFDIVVDDSMRRNVIVVDVYV